MKNTNIAKIRQFIRNWQNEAGTYTTVTHREGVLVDIINNRCKSLLALLPCETCGDVKVVPHGNWTNKPCPDCQKKPPNINPAETIAEYPESQPEIPIDK